MLSRWLPSRPLLPRALALSGAHRISPYDGVHLAAAEERGVRLLTLDAHLVRAAGEVGLDRLVELVA